MRQTSESASDAFLLIILLKNSSSRETLTASELKPVGVIKRKDQRGNEIVLLNTAGSGIHI